MRSLLIRIFISFWLIIGLTIGIAAISGYWYAERVRENFEDFEMGDTVLEASAALDAQGRQGLAEWLREFNRASTVALFVLDGGGQDILGRQFPRNVLRILERHRRHLRWDDRDRDHQHREPANVRRARPLSQLVGPDGEVYTLVLSHLPRPLMYRSGLPTGTALFVLALLVSAAVSYLLARAMTAPVSKLRAAAVSLADGNLDVRVADSLGSRRDELGLLARDFDEMARKLKNASQQQTELSRNISHELRSPLARMRVALELARRQAGDSPEFDRIDAEAERLDFLIGQILSYNRLDSGLVDELRDIDLADLIQDVVGDVDYECRSDGLSTVSVESQINARPIIRGDGDVVRSAVENVLRNAVRHSSPNSIVRITLDETGDHEANIGIADQGTGVSEEELSRLFDAFFRTKESTHDIGDDGSGLGLAIAARAIRIHGGEITAANRQSGGLRITMTLPARQAGLGKKGAPFLEM